MEAEKEGWAHLPWLPFKKAFLQKQLFGSQRAALTGRYISPDLVCFGCFGAAAITRDMGLPLFSSSTPASAAFPSRLLAFSLPVLHFWRSGAVVKDREEN